MYFMNPDQIKREEIEAFIKAVERAVSFCRVGRLGLTGLRLASERDREEERLDGIKQDLFKASQTALQNGSSWDGDSEGDVEMFIGRLRSEKGFRQYMSERVEKIGNELGRGGDVEVVPLRYQYGNYRTMLMRV